MEEIKKIIEDFRKVRNWHKYDTPDSLSKSIVIEAAELLEHFQFDEDFNLKEVSYELADILIYTLSFCYYLKLDPKELIKEKLIDVARRYPVKED